MKFHKNKWHGGFTGEPFESVNDGWQRASEAYLPISFPEAFGPGELKRSIIFENQHYFIILVLWQTLLTPFRLFSFKSIKKKENIWFKHLFFLNLHLNYEFASRPHHEEVLLPWLIILNYFYYQYFYCFSFSFSFIFYFLLLLSWS